MVLRKRCLGLFLILSVLLCSCGQNTQAPAPTQSPSQEQTLSPTGPPTEPEPVEYVLSFVGDCCLANKKGWSTNYYFVGTVGDNYAYPFEKVQEYFSNDDCTFVNLENPLTDAKGSKTKDFVFKVPMEYTRILTVGSVEFANIVNKPYHGLLSAWL